MIRTDIEAKVIEFTSKSDPNHRYASFDYCFNYFRTTKDLKKDVEKSCLALGFYLASWGMFRGSSFILQKSAKHLEPTIKYISDLDRSFWEIDVDNYTDDNIKTILDIYDAIKRLVIIDSSTDLTLTTKILLGVFGFIPAFDSYFTETFRNISDRRCGFRRVNLESLGVIKKFYEANRTTIDDLSNQIFTIDFVTEQETKINYSKAKIIDMYGFSVGQEIRALRLRPKTPE